jgi:glutamine synthetase
MSLPGIDGADPSGWHLHQSVLDTGTGRNLFAADAEDDLAPAGRDYLAGLLARARDLCLLSVPTVNGYHRLGPGFSLAPTRVGWSFEHRGVLVRATGGRSAHLENRAGEPSANPYLAMAAQLSAGLDGMLGRSEDGTAGIRDGRAGELPECLPASLAEALDAFRAGPAAELLGKPLAACLTRLKASEAARYAEWCAEHGDTAGGVTDWEQREYFEAY